MLPENIRREVDAATVHGHALVSQGCALFRCTRCEARRFLDDAGSGAGLGPCPGVPTDVIRFVITHVNREGMRTLTEGVQGRYTYATREEAQERLEAFRPSYAAQPEIGVPAETMEVRPVACWPGHFDPKTCWFDDATEPACRLCGKPATRYQDHGADGVLLFCDGHDAGEVEPFACEPLSAAPALYTVNGEGVTTLAGFLAANTDNIVGCLPEDGVCAVDEETIAAIRALDVGVEYSDGGGAWAEWTIRRVR